MLTLFLAILLGNFEIASLIIRSKYEDKVLKNFEKRIVWKDRFINRNAVQGGDGRRDAPVLLVFEFGRVVDGAAVAPSVEVLAGEGAGAVEGPAARDGREATAAARRAR